MLEEAHGGPLERILAASEEADKKRNRQLATRLTKRTGGDEWSE